MVQVLQESEIDCNVQLPYVNFGYYGTITIAGESYRGNSVKSNQMEFERLLIRKKLEKHLV